MLHISVQFAIKPLYGLLHWWKQFCFCCLFIYLLLALLLLLLSVALLWQANLLNWRINEVLFWFCQRWEDVRNIYACVMK